MTPAAVELVARLRDIALGVTPHAYSLTEAADTIERLQENEYLRDRTIARFREAAENVTIWFREGVDHLSPQQIEVLAELNAALCDTEGTE